MKNVNLNKKHMKNIHVLPTDEPSRIFYLASNLHLEMGQLITPKDYQNIYITSDEEINQQTEPCWCINTIKNTWDADLIYYQGSMPQYHYVGFKKIILTTDQDLIADGVQAIDDEFLEWFVKNPSCQYGGYKDIDWDKIITSKEEPKQETLEDIELEEVRGSIHCQFSVVENKLTALYRNQEKILTAIKLLSNGK